MYKRDGGEPGANLNGSARPAACWQSGLRRRQLRAVATSLVRSSESTSTNQMQYTQLLRGSERQRDYVHLRIGADSCVTTSSRVKK